MDKFAVNTRDLQLLESAMRTADERSPQTTVDFGDVPPIDSGLIPALAHAVHTSHGAVILTDAELDPPGPHIRYVNPAWERLTGYSAGDVLGRSPRIMQGEGSDRRVLDRLRCTLAAGRGFEGRIVNYRADGTPFILQWRIAPVRNESGEIEGFASNQEDVTEDWLNELRRHEWLAALHEDIAPSELPSLDGLDLALVRNTIDVTSNLGGDWADVVVAPDDRLHLIVGDVTGHGVVAALHVGRYRWSLRALLCSGASPAEALRTMTAVNHRAPAYATVGVVTIDAGRRTAEIITAGHPDVVIAGRGAARRVRIDAPLLGAVMDDDFAVAPQRVELQPGDVVCVCSDGLIERRHESLDVGIDALAEHLASVPPDPDHDLCAYAHEVVERLTDGEPTDDVLMLMARVRADG